MNRRQMIITLAVWGVLIVSSLAAAQFLARLVELNVQRAELSYSAFRAHVDAGRVERVALIGRRVEGTLREPLAVANSQGKKQQYREFATLLPDLSDDTLLPLLHAKGVEVEVRDSPGLGLVSVMLNALPFVFMLILLYGLWSGMRRGGHDVLAFGRSQARRYVPEHTRVTFDDVAGAEGAKGELREIVDFLKHPDKFQRLGAEIPRGVLLLGPPGTGKTLLARAVAGEAGVPFFSITGSEFVEMFVGVGASRVRDLFREAKANSPSIIFVDEIDSIGRQRGLGMTGAHEEREQTLNQLLAEMDGFEPNQEVVVMAATNRPDVLDPALLRPGRFDRRVVVDLPSLKEREAILKLHSRGKPLAPDVDLAQIARGTPGFSGADLANLLNEAALLAGRAGKSRIQAEDLDQARDKVMMGLERGSLIITEEEKRGLAYHEAGHALVALSLPQADPIHKVSIVPRGHALGVTQQLPQEEKHVYSRDYLDDKLAVLMGGRAAEDLILGAPTSGAENDLKEATRLARRMVLDWGMSAALGHLALNTRPDMDYLDPELGRRREYSEVTAHEVDREVRRVLDEAYERAGSILRSHRAVLDGIAQALTQREVLSGDEVSKLVAGILQPPAARWPRSMSHTTPVRTGEVQPA